MNKLSDKLHENLIQLRKTGMSIPEISKATGIAKTTVQRHIKAVEVPEQFLRALKEKQGGSKKRALALRENILEDSIEILGDLSPRDKLILLTGLYWGEGTKRDFEVINSDPFLIQTVILSLTQVLGINSDRISLCLRLHKGISLAKAKLYWSQVTGISIKTIKRVELVEGKKKGKLPHGMCRIRVKEGIRERIFIQSLIKLIGKECAKEVVSSKAAIVQWIEQGVPNP
jgi:hypothetical protein